jgi:hypothetical protein
VYEARLDGSASVWHGDRGPAVRIRTPTAVILVRSGRVEIKGSDPLLTRLEVESGRTAIAARVGHGTSAWREVVPGETIEVRAGSSPVRVTP